MKRRRKGSAKESELIGVLHWPDRLADWMADSGLMDERSRQGSGPAGEKR